MRTIANKISRLIAIGDIHGKADMLNRLLNVVDPQTEDQFVFLGDYIDRGKHSREVIDRLMQFGCKYPHTIFIRGNHDQLLLDTLVEVGVRVDNRLRDESEKYREVSPASDFEIFLSNGGNETLQSYWLSDIADFPLAHIKFLESTTLWWRYEIIYLLTLVQKWDCLKSYKIHTFFFGNGYHRPARRVRFILSAITQRRMESRTLSPVGIILILEQLSD